MWDFALIYRGIFSCFEYFCNVASIFTGFWSRVYKKNPLPETHENNNNYDVGIIPYPTRSLLYNLYYPNGENNLEKLINISGLCARLDIITILLSNQLWQQSGRSSNSGFLCLIYLVYI